MKKSLLMLLTIFISSVITVFAQQAGVSVNKEELNMLVVTQNDLVVEVSSEDEEDGVHLYVKKKPDIESVMLVETTKDPAGKADNYAYRAKEWNKWNGEEIRLLNGKELKSEYSKYSLISSTVVQHEKLGDCFHIFIPRHLEYGYPWTRNGTIEIGKGTFVNIRSFSKRFGDYTGDFKDNPFMFDFPEAEKKVVSLTDEYNPLAAQKFEEIASKGKGLITYSKGPETITEDLLNAVEELKDESKVDIVFAIDTTGSMKNDMETLRTKWIPELENQLKEFSDFRIGLLFYRDYNDNYNYKGLPVKYFNFSTTVEQFSRCLNTAIIKGNEGGDIPEAVYEALYAGLQFYEWRPEAYKKIILIGDAEPHPKPRGPKKLSQETIIRMANEKNVILDCIIVPDDSVKK